MKMRPPTERARKRAHMSKKVTAKKAKSKKLTVSASGESTLKTLKAGRVAMVAQSTFEDRHNGRTTDVKE